MIQAITEIQRLSKRAFDMVELAQHHQAQGAHAERATSGIMGAIGQRKITVNIDPVVREQLIDVDERRSRLTFRHHLGTTGMMGLDDIFRFMGLFLEGIDFLE
jgi:hypothetical protein